MQRTAGMCLGCVQDELGKREGGEKGMEQERGQNLRGLEWPSIILSPTQRTLWPSFLTRASPSLCSSKPVWARSESPA